VPQTSDAVGAVKFGVAGQLIVPFSSGVPLTDRVLSTTVIICATVEL